MESITRWVTTQHFAQETDRRFWIERLKAQVDQCGIREEIVHWITDFRITQEAGQSFAYTLSRSTLVHKDPPQMEVLIIYSHYGECGPPLHGGE